MRVLVTGGTGYLGRAIVRGLASRGHEPVVFSRHATTSRLPCFAVDGDVRDATALRRAAEPCDAVCHTAALVSLWRRRPEDYDEVNVGGLRAVLEMVADLRIPRLVYTSSFLALPPSDGGGTLRANDYQRTKVDALEHAERAIDAGSPMMILFPGVVYGPGANTEGNLVGRLLADHLSGRLAGVVGADRMWSYSYIEDVAAGHVAALERGRIGARYRLCGENAPQMRVFEIAREITGRPLPRRLPFALASAVGLAEEVRVRLLGGAPLITRGAVEIFRRDWAYDSNAAIEDLGYRITPLREGVKKTVDDIRAAMTP